MMPPIRLLILDFDGVIVESNDVKTEAFRRVFSRFPEHADAMMQYHHAHVSESRFTKFAHLVMHRMGRSEADPLMAELADAFSKETVDLVSECEPVAGARELLEVAAAAVPVYLASVTPQADLDAILHRRRLTRFFTRAYGCPPWTKPDAIRDIVGASGTEGVLLIGDSAGDQRAARATGVEFLARDSGLPFDDPQPAMGRDLHELLAHLHGRFPSTGSAQ